jgi:DNA-binding response OmpR family regulator
MQSNGGPHVLLISDEQRLLDALVTAFRSVWPTAEILTACGAATVAQLVFDRNLKLVVLDADLSERNGFDVLADIRRTSNVPVVLLTGGGRWSDESRKPGIEVNLRLPKPFSTRALIRFARRVVDRDDQILPGLSASIDAVEIQPSDAEMPTPERSG